VGKVYNLCRVKTDISAVLTVKSGLDPHMITKSWTMFMVMVIVDHVYGCGYAYAVSLLSLLMCVLV
jgi:hypothetical protein